MELLGTKGVGVIHEQRPSVFGSVKVSEIHLRPRIKGFAGHGVGDDVFFEHPCDLLFWSELKVWPSLDDKTVGRIGRVLEVALHTFDR